MASKIYKSLVPLSEYMDRKFKGTKAEYDKAIAESPCLYVGNLSFFTKEEQIAEVFGKAGELDRVVMGLDRNTKTPCGFCFVIFKTRQGAERAVAYLNGTMLDEREIRADFDWGFEDGRQFGRGKSGGQMRDEYRTEYDQERGGYGKVMEAELRGGGGAGFGSPGFGGSPGFRGGGVPPPGPRRQPQQQQQPVRPQKRSRPSDEGGDAKRARGEENARFAREREQDDEED